MNLKSLVFLLLALTHASAFADGPRCVEIFVLHDIPSPRLINNNFETKRGLDRYEHLFTATNIPPLKNLIESLSPGSIYLDAGAGHAVALREALSYRASRGLPSIKGFAVAFKKPNDQKLDAELKAKRDQFAYVEGDLIERLVSNPQSQLSAIKNQVSLITEVIGPVAYTKNISTVLNAYTDLLRVGGQVLIYFHEGSSQFYYPGKNDTYHRLTLRELQFLIPEATGGRLVVREARMRLEGLWPRFDETVLWLEKVSHEPVAIPNDPFRLAFYKDAPPPLREYHVVSAQNLESAATIRERDLEAAKTQFQKAWLPYGFSELTPEP